MNTVVTGANRGIGLELTRQLSARGDRVDAAVREPERADELRALAGSSDGLVRVHRCDVADDASVRAFADTLGDRAVDLLINNAGVVGPDRQSLGELDFDGAVHAFEVNALGPLRMAFALLPNLRRADGAKIVSITSGMGSIGDNDSGGSYAYRMSKAALNMGARNLAMDLRDDGIASAVINPGWVKTDMGGPHATISAAESVENMLGRIDALTLDDSGSFLNWRGGGYPW